MRALFCLFLLSNFCYAQQSKIDSLVLQLETLPQDTNRVHTLNLLTNTFLNASKYKEGLETGSEALQLAQKLDFKPGVATAYGNIGFIYHRQGNYTQALENQFASLKIKESLNDKVGMGNSLNRIGLVYEKLNSYDKALEYHLASLKVKLEIGNKAPIAASYNNIGNIYFAQKNYPLALENYNASLKLKIELNDKKGTASSYNNLAAIYHEQKNYPEALKNYLTSLKLKEDFKDRYGQAVTHNNIGDLYIDQHKIAMARQEETKALELAEKIGANEVIMASYRMLAMCDSATGDFKSAYRNYKAYKQYSDTLFNKDNSQKMAQMSELYESEKKERQIKELELGKKEASFQLVQSANQRNLFIGFTLGLTIIAFLIFIQFLQKKKSNSLLSEKNLVIEKSLHERETLLKEIHHRVKNNLQIISSLLSLQSKSLDNSAAQGAITESRNRVKSMSLIHEQLYQEDTISGVEMKDYISRLVSSLTSSYGLDTDRVEIRIDAENILLDVDSAIPLGLIINELVSNSMKYAFPEQRNGSILISLKHSRDELLLQVKDNGVGMDSSIKSNQSFGLSMVNSLMRKLKAEMNIVSQAGTSVHIIIKDFKKITLA